MVRHGDKMLENASVVLTVRRCERCMTIMDEWRGEWDADILRCCGKSTTTRWEGRTLRLRHWFYRLREMACRRFSGRGGVE